MGRSIEEVASVVRYDAETGQFFALEDGRLLSTKHPKGYVRVRILGADVLAHRLAWHMSGRDPAESIDHINRVKSDNRLSNLRAATASQNQCNRDMQVNNTSGVVGVARNARGDKWLACIKINGRRKHLGVFREFDDAVAVRRGAEPVVKGEFCPQ